MPIDPTIFREYDIRGIVGESLTSEIVRRIGFGFGQELVTERLEEKVVIGSDARSSSASFRRDLAIGLNQSGIDVIDLGELPSPVIYFAIHELGMQHGIAITGSHNPPEYNGLKIVKGRLPFAGDSIRRLYQRVATIDATAGMIRGNTTDRDINERYEKRLLSDISIDRPVKVVVDSGNGICGRFVAPIYQKLGCEVVAICDEIDSTFPNHHPDPTLPENLIDLIAAVEESGAELGIGFDGDGDRIGVVTNLGQIIWCDRLAQLFATAILADRPGAKILFDVKCSKSLADCVQLAGGRPIMWRTGHSHLKLKQHETNALLAAEFSGHVCFADRWYGTDDAIYAGARLLELVSATDISVDQLFENYEQLPATPELFVNVPDTEKFDLMRKLQQHGNFDTGDVSLIDGIRVDTSDGWGVLRVSNTSPKLTMRFEGKDAQSITSLYDLFRRELSKIAPQLQMPNLPL